MSISRNLGQRLYPFNLFQPPVVRATLHSKAVDVNPVFVAASNISIGVLSLFCGGVMLCYYFVL